MSAPFYNSKERIAKLIAAADKMFGTPWCANADAVGVHGGIACHHLPRRMWIESEFLDESFPKISGTPNDAAHQPIMEQFADKCFQLARLPIEGLNFQPGDMLGIWLACDEYGRRVRNRHANHLGVVLDGGWFMHVLMHKKADRDLFRVSPWAERIVAAWRPVETCHSSPVTDHAP